MATAKIVTKHKKSILPKTLDDIKKLPGIGDYTGNILLALVYNQPRLALDGNVKRVLSRYLGIKTRYLQQLRDDQQFEVKLAYLRV